MLVCAARPPSEPFLLSDAPLDHAHRTGQSQQVDLQTQFEMERKIKTLASHNAGLRLRCIPHQSSDNMHTRGNPSKVMQSSGIFPSPGLQKGRSKLRSRGVRSTGYWTIAPTSNIAGIALTLVLEPKIPRDHSVTDFPRPFASTRRTHLPEIIRVIEGLETTSMSDLNFHCSDSTMGHPSMHKLDEGIHTRGPDSVVVVSPAEVSLDDHKVTCDITVKPEERYVFQIVWHRSWEETPKAGTSRCTLGRPRTSGVSGARSVRTRGKAREAIMRSLITLKSLTYWPSGGIVAALTTSLPESIGGERNWDYRYCWLRDSSVTLEALNRCGYLEAQAFRDWLLRAVASDPSQMQIMYGISGERHLTESTVDWLRIRELSAGSNWQRGVRPIPA